MIIREESDESLFYDFTPVSMISDRGDFYFRDWMNSLSVGPHRFSLGKGRQGFPAQAASRNDESARAPEPDKRSGPTERLFIQSLK